MERCLLNQSLGFFELGIPRTSNDKRCRIIFQRRENQLIVRPVKLKATHIAPGQTAFYLVCHFGSPALDVVAAATLAHILINEVLLDA